MSFVYDKWTARHFGQQSQAGLAASDYFAGTSTETSYVLPDSTPVM